MKTIRLTMRRKRVAEGFVFIFPWLIGTVIFFIRPLIESIILSFSKVTSVVGFKTQLTGLENYLKALTIDIEFISDFLKTVEATVINIPLIIVFSLFIAILLNHNVVLRSFFRGVFLLPVVLGTGFVMQQLLGQHVDQQATDIARGILLPENVLVYLSPGVQSMVQSFLDRITIILWKSGVQIIIFLGGLQTIPKSLYESARCDSATEWEMFWLITFPMITQVMLLNIVYTIVDSFTDSTNAILESVLTWGFKNYELGYASAIAWIYLIFIFIFIGLIFLIFNIVLRHRTAKN